MSTRPAMSAICEVCRSRENAIEVPIRTRIAMPDASFFAAVDAAISASVGAPFRSALRRPAGSNHLLGRDTSQPPLYFLKTLPASDSALDVERAGLLAILATRTVRAPEPIAHGEHGGTAFLACSYLDLSPHARQSECWRSLGRDLARMHRHTSPAGQYGLEMDGTIGLSAQPNGWLPSWPQFFAERRIGHMLRLARSQDPRSFPLGEKVIAALPKLLPERPPASLLHGDLWGGNAAAAKDGGVIFDPAPYYGDREADLAMTELFGRFPKPFYEGYNEEWPLEPGYNKRRTVYNLYHVMNHHVLFGGGYGRQAERMMEEILAWVAEKGA